MGRGNESNECEKNSLKKQGANREKVKVKEKSNHKENRKRCNENEIQ